MCVLSLVHVLPLDNLDKRVACESFWYSFIVLNCNCSSLKICKIGLDIECIFGWWRQESVVSLAQHRSLIEQGSPLLQCWVAMLKGNQMSPFLHPNPHLTFLLSSSPSCCRIHPSTSTATLSNSNLVCTCAETKFSCLCIWPLIAASAASLFPSFSL